MKKFHMYEEVAYLIGINFLALGTALATMADFGLSMVVAPAYIFHLKISEINPFFTFGVAEYTLQALLILALVLVEKKIKRRFIFSFVTAVFYGIVLDFWVEITHFIPSDTIQVRILLYVLSLLLCATGVAFLFNTYIAPEAYELIVKEIADRSKMKISRIKMIYDCSSLLISICLSFLFFGFGVFKGIGIGTIISAVCNGFLIGIRNQLIQKYIGFKRNEKLYRLLN